MNPGTEATHIADAAWMAAAEIHITMAARDKDLAPMVRQPVWQGFLDSATISRVVQVITEIWPWPSNLVPDPCDEAAIRLIAGYGGWSSTGTMAAVTRLVLIALSPHPLSRHHTALQGRLQDCTCTTTPTSAAPAPRSLPYTDWIEEAGTW